MLELNLKHYLGLCVLASFIEIPEPMLLIADPRVDVRYLVSKATRRIDTLSQR